MEAIVYVNVYVDRTMHQRKTGDLTVGVQTLQPLQFDRETHSLGCQLTVSQLCHLISW